MEKLTVTQEVAEALDSLKQDKWSKQFNLICHCKGFSGNGILHQNIYTDDLKVLESLSPLEFAQCLIAGYEPTPTQDPKHS